MLQVDASGNALVAGSMDGDVVVMLFNSLGVHVWTAQHPRDPGFSYQRLRDLKAPRAMQGQLPVSGLCLLSGLG